ncbi:MAG: acyltransferase [Desulfosporosinus sp.]|nr:acyltransferase [Desulfosporosinus sp.]
MKNTIESYSLTRRNNFDFIRFVAAVLVVISHSFPLSLGNNLREPLMILTKGQLTLGTMAVDIFFIISGFLITQSYDRSNNFIRFIKARVLRIYPALIVVVFLSAFILGPIVTSLSITDYFRSYQTYRYLTSAFIFHALSNNLPGVFSNNIYAPAVNGSLWTLAYEFKFYLLVGFLGLTRILNRKTVLALFLLSFASSIFLTTHKGLMQYCHLLNFYSAGMLIYLAREYIPLNIKLAFTSFVLLLISCFIGHLQDVSVFCGSYFIMYFAFNTRLNLSNFAKYGDFSYGVYIFAFPVQQTIIHFFGGSMAYPILIFLYSLPIVLLCAILSWHLVEKVALQLKSYKILSYSRRFPWVDRF